jgi:hypothetical protein
MMREKSLLRYWVDKGHSATIVSARMENYFGSSVPSCSWVTKGLRAPKRGEDTVEACERSGRPPWSIEWPESARIPQSGPVREHPPNWHSHQGTAFSCIRSFERMELRSGAFKVDSPSLTTAMIEQRVAWSRELLVTFRSAKQCGWTHLLTGNES